MSRSWWVRVPRIPTVKEVYRDRDIFNVVGQVKEGGFKTSSSGGHSQN